MNKKIYIAKVTFDAIWPCEKCGEDTFFKIKIESKLTRKNSSFSSSRKLILNAIKHSIDNDGAILCKSCYDELHND